MAIEGAAAAVPLSPGERVHGMNHIAELRAKVFRKDIRPDIERFFSDMRNPRDINHAQNIRALAALFFTAGIKAERHNMTVNELTDSEVKELIKAMNIFKGLVGVLPKQLAVPLLVTPA